MTDHDWNYETVLNLEKIVSPLLAKNVRFIVTFKPCYEGCYFPGLFIIFCKIFESFPQKFCPLEKIYLTLSVRQSLRTSRVFEEIEKTVVSSAATQCAGNR